jgi:hypothetical protein
MHRNQTTSGVEQFEIDSGVLIFRNLRLTERSMDSAACVACRSTI